MRTALVLDRRFEAHDPGAGHPESPARIRAVLEVLSQYHRPGLITLAPRAATAGELALNQASLTDAKWQQFPVPALHVDSATLKFSVQGNRLEIQEFDAVGPELKLSASGQVALRPNLADSVLNLKVSIAPGAESPDEIKALLLILPQPAKGAKPDAPRVLSGTLAKPRLR